MEVNPFWVIILGLPTHFWPNLIFQNIGNLLGVYMEHESSYLTTSDMSMTCILISVNLWCGLLGEIHMGANVSALELDYEGVPCRCKRCYKQGHPEKILCAPFA